MVSGMQGLAIFATSAGVSSRPPLFWGADRIVSTVYHSPYIFALNSSSLIVFKCVLLQKLFRNFSAFPFKCDELN